MSSDFPVRKSIRLTGYDYSIPGAYFITIVTFNRRNRWGNIANNMMNLNNYGRVIENEWLLIPKSHPGVLLDEFIVMPNHLHGIVCITEHQTRIKLGGIINLFKSRTTRIINNIEHTIGQAVWQRSYYDHIIRNEQEWDRCRLYIQSNPENWDKDKEYS